LALEKDSFGKNIVSEHKIFDGFALSVFNTKTQSHGIDHILKSIEGDLINKTKLRTRYDEFIAVYKD
jgi:hypothetical protein